MPAIAAWRKVRALAQAKARTRMLHLEIAVIEEHELTLLPASFPWGWEERRDEVRQREGALGVVEAGRNRALLRLWVRRLLTFGVWRD